MTKVYCYSCYTAVKELFHSDQLVVNENGNPEVQCVSCLIDSKNEQIQNIKDWENICRLMSKTD